MSLMTFFAIGVSIGFLFGLLMAYSKRLFVAVLVAWVVLFLALVLVYGAEGDATLAQDLAVFFGSLLGTLAGIIAGEEVFGR